MANEIIESSMIICPTEVDGLWTKKRNLFMRLDDGSLVRVGEHTDALFEFVDKGEDDSDYITMFSADDFTPQKRAIRRLYVNELAKLHETK